MKNEIYWEFKEDQDVECFLCGEKYKRVLHVYDWKGWYDLTGEEWGDFILEANKDFCITEGVECTCVRCEKSFLAGLDFVLCDNVPMEV